MSKIQITMMEEEYKCLLDLAKIGQEITKRYTAMCVRGLKDLLEGVMMTGLGREILTKAKDYQVVEDEPKKMTCREKCAKEHPDKAIRLYSGGCVGCPGDYGYIKSLTAGSEKCTMRCRACWDQEVET